ncbi:dihydrofolate reductase family protein [Nocardia sp. NPDC059180]|uniref:dihydrofolate reductase family protein n=1 Tax=Nocardia sp. NPDC059180 TaxID=3346761 RepID=UPI0036C743A4
MSNIIAVVSVTLDGVMQAPGRANEDPRDGFAHGGWAYRFTDEVQARVMAEHIADHHGALLLGRRTYLDFAGYWPQQTGNPFTDVLNKTDKYVASTTLTDPLPWQNSILLDGDAVTAVRRVRQQRPDLDLVVLGSGNLLQSLMAHGLVDEYLLQIHPLVVGAGRRLFDGRTELGDLRLVDCVPTTTGVLIATYRTTDRS